jgi:alpha-beta hydrolase superfamily lysophospholipase
MDDRIRRRPTTGRVLGTVAVSIGAAAALGSVAAGALVVAVARKVVTPTRRRVEDLKILALTDTTVTLSISPESRLPGTYSLWFDGGRGHARIGGIISLTESAVTRELVGVDSGDLRMAARARLGGWVFRSPRDLNVRYRDVFVRTPLGPAPAWLIPAAEPSGAWAIAVHGRGVRRAETLRAVSAFRDAGYAVLLVSYRNDGDAPSSDDGLYALGDTEWEDVDAALGYAVDNGATDVVLMGWSMGGATVLQAATRSPRANIVRGIVLESPVVDWVTALEHQGRGLGLANPFRHGVLRVLSRKWGGRVTGQHQPIDLARLDFVARASELNVPILLIHSIDDTFVPADASRALAQRRPDIVTYKEFHTAGHTKLWNFDAPRWNAAISGWLARLALPGSTAEPKAGLQPSGSTENFARQPVAESE